MQSVLLTIFVCSATRHTGVIYYWQGFALPSNWTLFARESYIAHLLPKFILSTAVCLITFINLTVFISVNPNMLALD